MSVLSQSGGKPERIYYPHRRGVAVTATYLQVESRTYVIRDLARVGWLRGRYSATWQLWAYHRTVSTLLWVSADRIEFFQVCRALQRAIEAYQERSLYRG